MRPRKRAEGQTPRIGVWAASTEKRLLGFAGYKAGMTTVSYIDDSTSPNAGNEIFGAVTVLEVPPMMVYGVRGMKYGQTLADELTTDEKILKILGNKPKAKNKLEPSSVSEIFVLAYAQSHKTGFGRKHPDKMMIAVGGKDMAEKLDYARSLVGKEIKASEVFKPGEYVDAVAITTGKGWQGAVKRHGIMTQRRKATGKVRHAGTLGAWHPGYVLYTVPHAGQMGYHKRTEMNKRVMKMVEPAAINPRGGFPHYGVVKNECILIKGSLNGPVKRLVRLRKAVRKSEVKAPDMRDISLQPKN